MLLSVSDNDLNKIVSLMILFSRLRKCEMNIFTYILQYL